MEKIFHSFAALSALVKYLFHSKINFIYSRHRVISSVYNFLFFNAIGIIAGLEIATDTVANAIKTLNLATMFV